MPARVVQAGAEVAEGLGHVAGEQLLPFRAQHRPDITLALPKRGLLAPGARRWVGELHLADISVPEKVYQRLGLTVGSIFANSDIISIDLP